MRVLVTGACGFIGGTLVRRLLRDASVDEIVAIDIAAPSAPIADGRLRWVIGGLDARAAMDTALRDPFDRVFHLASVPGGLAETHPALGRRVNLDASLDLLQRLADGPGCPRVVYASSIAVYGAGTGPVSSQTPARPPITYGAHKRMIEIALADHTRRGEMSGIAVRLPGIVARQKGAGDFGSAFMSDILHTLSADEAYVCPVSPAATAWWLSAERAAHNLGHAGAMSHRGEVQLPALRLSIQDVVDGIARVFANRCGTRIRYRPDERIEATFGRFPELDTAAEEALGFVHDGSVEALIENAIADQSLFGFS